MSILHGRNFSSQPQGDRPPWGFHGKLYIVTIIFDIIVHNVKGMYEHGNEM